MNKELYIGTVTLVLAFALIYVPIGYAQDLSTNASNAAGNMTASANQTASELGQNASTAVNRTGESLEELGKNASEVGGNILNKT
ncbi:MAG: hypothetical protein WAM16_01235, partial [Nitrososphaeraceae archaeon]